MQEVILDSWVSVVISREYIQYFPFHLFLLLSKLLIRTKKHVLSSSEAQNSDTDHVIGLSDWVPGMSVTTTPKHFCYFIPETSRYLKYTNFFERLSISNSNRFSHILWYHQKQREATTSDCAAWWMDRGRISVEGCFLIFRKIQSSSGAHPASNSIGSVVLF